MRIDVVGLPASGKSTLAAAISKKLSIPHIHLDQFWFESGGRTGRYDTPNIEEVRAKVKLRALEAIQADSWVSDGIYMNAQEEIAARADVIVFLDIPLSAQLLNHARRAFFEPKRHAELGLWDEIKFFREIVRRNHANKPKLLRFIEAHREKVVTLRSQREATAYLEQLVAQL